jgi:tight adherence protein C
VKDITRGLPHAIEIAALCMSAGADFPGALRLIATTGGRASDDALRRELSLILEELELGHTRREALVHLSERVPSPAVRDFVNAVIQAEEKGNPLARVIQIQGRTLNQRRSVAAEEAAARAGVLMIAPLMLLLCAILLLLMGPFIVSAGAL